MSAEKKLDCDIVKDLLPLYCEDLVSETSRKAVEDHFAQCCDCRDLYCDMRAEFEKEADAEMLKTEILPFKKVRRAVNLKIAAAFILTLLFCTGVFCFLYVGVVPINAEDLQVTYTAEKNGEREWIVHFEIENTSGRALVLRDAQIPGKHEMTAYSVYHFPLDDLDESMSYEIRKDEPFEENEAVVIKCRDRNMVYSLDKIAEECGI